MFLLHKAQEKISEYVLILWHFPITCTIWYKKKSIAIINLREKYFLQESGAQQSNYFNHRCWVILQEGFLTRKVINIYDIISVFGSKLSNYIQVEEMETLHKHCNNILGNYLTSEVVKQVRNIIYGIIYGKRNRKQYTSLRRSSLASFSSNGRGGSSAKDKMLKKIMTNHPRFTSGLYT